MVEALRNTAPSGSWCEGIEPMVPKAEDAQRRGFPVRAAYLCDVSEKYDVASIVDIFSHVPDFRSFLGELKEVLLPRGEIFIKTGNGADVGDRCRIPEPLNLPDHLVFAGRAHLTQFLEEAGFEVVSLSAHRVDGLIYSARNTVKWLIGKPVRLGLPYASPLRTIYLRARLREG
jgi:hypothetical protein